MAFRSEGDVEQWAKSQCTEIGAIVDMQTVFQLGHDWYSGRFDPNWDRPEADDVVSMFASLGLTGPFWSLG
jgi:hypothetical protein